MAHNLVQLTTAVVQLVTAVVALQTARLMLPKRSKRRLARTKSVSHVGSFLKQVSAAPRWRNPTKCSPQRS